MNNFVMLATTAGYPRDLVLDFLDQLGRGRWQDITKPTLEWLREYEDDIRTQNSSQMRWDIQQGNRNAGAIRGRFGC